jgi:hypothetical protein
MKVNGFPEVSWPKRSRRYYAIVTVHGETKQTTISARGNMPTWDETFVL